MIVVAVILALVGLLGLAAAMAINVAERTRELGIMTAIGASDCRIAGVVVGEALAIGVASAVVAVELAIPLTALADAMIASRGFLAPPPFAVSVAAVVCWRARSRRG